jgi:hypothetical protein
MGVFYAHEIWAYEGEEKGTGSHFDEEDKRSATSTRKTRGSHFDEQDKTLGWDEHDWAVPEETAKQQEEERRIRSIPVPVWQLSIGDCVW